MRMFLLFILLLIPLNGYADNPCRGLDPESCTATAGCYLANECVQCKEEYYCPAGESNRKKCSDLGDGTFTLSDAGATEEEDCYKKVDCIHWFKNTSKTCKSYYDSSLIDCGDGMNSNTTVHLENDTCYTGYLNCDQFNNDCTGTVSGYTKWDPSIGKWHTAPTSTNRCRCESDYTSETCTGTQKHLTYYNQVYIDRTTQINFVPSEYFCKQCMPGYYVNAATDINSDHENDDCENDKVCKCTIVPKGYYINGQCPAIPDSITNMNNDICPPSPCPAGQTTDGPGALSLTECHFTADTKFCDAGGCFTLGDIKNQHNIEPLDWQTVGN